MPTTTSNRGNRGFTVMELVTVAMVMAILAVIAIPSTSMSHERKLDVLQLQLQDAMDRAQAMAYHTGSKHAAIFNPNHQWIAVINSMIVPMEDPLTHAMYIVHLGHPDQPSGIRIDSSNFNGRYFAGFDEKGVLTSPGNVLISANGSQRLLSANTATAELTEIPITP